MGNMDIEVKRAYEEILNRATKNVKWKDLIYIKTKKSYQVVLGNNIMQLSKYQEVVISSSREQYQAVE